MYVCYITFGKDICTENGSFVGDTRVKSEMFHKTINDSIRIHTNMYVYSMCKYLVMKIMQAMYN